MSDKTTTVNVGGGLFSTLLLILFIGLKLTGQITWSWLWVLSPMWMPIVIVLVLLVVFGLFAALVR